jgi:hypothetical protein
VYLEKHAREFLAHDQKQGSGSRSSRMRTDLVCRSRQNQPLQNAGAARD